MQIGSEDPVAARIIYLTSSNYYPYTKLGKEKDIIHSLLAELEKKRKTMRLKNGHWLKMSLNWTLEV